MLPATPQSDVQRLSDTRNKMSEVLQDIMQKSQMVNHGTETQKQIEVELTALHRELTAIEKALNQAQASIDRKQNQIDIVESKSFLY